MKHLESFSKRSLLRITGGVLLLAAASMIGHVRSAVQQTIAEKDHPQLQSQSKPQSFPQSQPQTAPQSRPLEKTAYIASWNLSFLNDEDNRGLSPRVEKDYQAISRVIEETRASIICVQEVENDRAVHRVIRHLPHYFSYVTRDTGALDTAIIYDTRTAAMKNVRLLTEVNDNEFTFARLPLMADFELGDFDGKMIVIHLKAGENRESCRRRNTEIQRIREWIHNYLQNPDHDPDVVIIGDWNQLPDRNGWPHETIFLFPVTGTLIRSNRVVDGAIGTPDTAEEINKNSIEVLRSEAIRRIFNQHRVSDHWPVRLMARIDTGTADRK